MGHGASSEKKGKKQYHGRIASTPQPPAATAAPVANRGLSAVATNEAQNSTQPIFTNTQVEVETKETKMSSTHGSNVKRSGINSKTTRQTSENQSAAPKAIISERMVAQFTKENQVSREEEKRMKEQSVIDWCNNLKFPIPQDQDALFRHDASMAELRKKQAADVHN